LYRQVTLCQRIFLLLLILPLLLLLLRAVVFMLLLLSTTTTATTAAAATTTHHLINYQPSPGDAHPDPAVRCVDWARESNPKLFNLLCQRHCFRVTGAVPEVYCVSA
jgi:hypothetical protein